MAKKHWAVVNVSTGVVEEYLITTEDQSPEDVRSMDGFTATEIESQPKAEQSWNPETGIQDDLLATSKRLTDCIDKLCLDVLEPLYTKGQYKSEMYTERAEEASKVTTWTGPDNELQGVFPNLYAMAGVWEPDVNVSYQSLVSMAEKVNDAKQRVTSKVRLVDAMAVKSKEDIREASDKSSMEAIAASFEQWLSEQD